MLQQPQQSQVSTTADEPSACILMIFYTAYCNNKKSATSPGQKWCCWVATSSVTRCSWLGFHIAYSFFCGTKEEREEQECIFSIFSAQIPACLQHARCRSAEQMTATLLVLQTVLISEVFISVTLCWQRILRRADLRKSAREQHGWNGKTFC